MSGQDTEYDQVVLATLLQQLVFQAGRNIGILAVVVGPRRHFLAVALQQPQRRVEQAVVGLHAHVDARPGRHLKSPALVEVFLRRDQKAFPAFSNTVCMQ